MLARLWYLQVLNAPTYEKAAIVDQIRHVYIPAPRGLVLDRNGNVLVGNATVNEVTVSRTEAEQHSDVVTRLALLLGLTPQQIAQSLSNQFYSPLQPVPVATNVAVSKVAFIQEHPAEFPGVKIELVSEPSYPYGTLAAQVLGYLGEISQGELSKLKGQGYQPGDVIGQSGVEESYQAELAGRPGVESVAVDSHGNVVSTSVTRRPVPGDDVQLSIDANLEQFVANALASEIKTIRNTYDPYDHEYDPAPDGAVVVEDPRNGQILAMASYPTYDPSVWVGGISQSAWQQLQSTPGNPLINHAIQSGYTPGSTFKLITATAALDDGLITPNTYIDDATGYFTIPNCTGQCRFHDDDSAAAGDINVVTAITVSDDVFFYTLGYDFYVNQARYGPTPIQDMAAKYGYGEPTGVDLPGESPGLVDSLATRQYLHSHFPRGYPNPPSWYPGDQVEMAFGQGATLVTPLQLANAYATFANGGFRYVPKAGADALDPATCQVDTGFARTFSPQVAGRVDYAPDVYQTLLAGFSGVIQNPAGTGYGAFVGFPLSQIPLAGKTGTASTANQAPNSLFVSFGPTNDPQYVVAAVIDQAGYGASAAAPVVRQVWDYLATNPIGPVRKPNCSSPTGPVSQAPPPNPPLGATTTTVGG
jgi:penicillin-binding protein 2